MKEERIELSQRDIDRLRVIREVIARRLGQADAGQQLGIGARQVRKLCRKVRQDGNRGIIHGLRGRSSNHRLAQGVLASALKLVERQYTDFGPTLANEKLRQRHGIKLSVSVLRQGMMEAGLWVGRRRRAKHRAWRQRRACLGELIQLDGSTHPWLENRAEPCVLVVYIDDATSRLMYAEFVASEDTLTLLRTTGQYLSQWGRPVAFYVDRDSIYKINRQATIEEQLREGQPTTQFTRAMQDLGIEVITAHSPQAKGRVERLFGTLQDRLVKELRLAKINQMGAANQFLWSRFIPFYNQRFAQAPRNKTNAHRPVLQQQRLEEILSIRVERTLMNDFTLRYQNRWYQVLDKQAIRVRPQDKILVEQRLEGTIHLRFRDRYLKYNLLDQRPAAKVQIHQKRRQAPLLMKRWKPAPNHPWRRPALINERTMLHCDYVASR